MDFEKERDERKKGLQMISDLKAQIEGYKTTIDGLNGEIASLKLQLKQL